MGILQARIPEWVAMPSSRDLHDPGIELRSPSLQEDSLLTEPPGKPKNTGVGSLSLLQGIFPTQESEWGLLHGRQILYQLSSQGSSLASYMGLPVFLGVAGPRRAFSMLCASESRDCFYRGMDRTLVYALGRVHIVVQPCSCSESLLLWGPGAPVGDTQPCHGGPTGATQTGTEGPDRGWQGFRIWQAGEKVPDGRKEGLGWLWEFCPRNTAFTQMHVFPSKARDLTR